MRHSHAFQTVFQGVVISHFLKKVFQIFLRVTEVKLTERIPDVPTYIHTLTEQLNFHLFVLYFSST